MIATPDSRRYDVSQTVEVAARAFVEANHYTATYAAARRADGPYDCDARDKHPDHRAADGHPVARTPEEVAS